MNLISYEMLLSVKQVTPFIAAEDHTCGGSEIAEPTLAGSKDVARSVKRKQISVREHFSKGAKQDSYSKLCHEWQSSIYREDKVAFLFSFFFFFSFFPFFFLSKVKSV